MYHLSDSLESVKGIGRRWFEVLQAKGLQTVLDLLLFVPLRYEDRSEMVDVSQIPTDRVVTFSAQVKSFRSAFKGHKSMQSAVLADGNSQVKAMWFNSTWLKNKLKIGQQFLFSGQKNSKGWVVQPVVEDIKVETLHTGRLVPVYSALPGIKSGTARRFLKEILDHLVIPEDRLSMADASLLDLKSSIKQIHFPEVAEMVVKARERLAVGELLGLIFQSHKMKSDWQSRNCPYEVKVVGRGEEGWGGMASIPFELTPSQLRATHEILNDLSQKKNHISKKMSPMNRLLIGDVGSGKTVVAAIASWHVINSNFSVALIAPTQILAEQHFQTIQELLPDVDVKLITGKTKANSDSLSSTPCFFVGTHALINKLGQINPGLIIYDEQHKFGVSQRSFQDNQPHILTMSATPIPRSLMLSIFSHLDVSVIDELPPGRKPVKTWYTNAKKRDQAYKWVAQQVVQAKNSNFPIVGLIVCPFIDVSTNEGLSNVASVETKFLEVKKFVEEKFGGKLVVEKLHGQMSNQAKQAITKRLFDNQIDFLVTTPIIEVGLDVPSASIIVIEGAERFGMASLHQMRGRVGRAGQQAYCLLFSSDGTARSARLSTFCSEHNGLKLAEQDLKSRGAGNLFGTQQHGFDYLRFAEWTNLKLITQARQLFDIIHQQQLNWQPLFNLEKDQHRLVLNN